MTMEEGILSRWLVPDGGEVKRGQPIFEMETEKVQMEVEADGGGVLRQLVPPDTTLKPGDIVGAILAAGEELPAQLVAAVAAQRGNTTSESPTAASAAPPSPNTLAATEAGRVRATPIARRLAEENGIALETLTGSGPDGRIQEQDVRRAIEAKAETATSQATVLARDVRASPIARRLAIENGIDLSTLRGSGPDGRIVERDVNEAMETMRALPSGADAAIEAHAEGASSPYSGRRRTIGERMMHSLQSMAQLTLVSETQVDDAMSMLHGLNREWRRDGVVVTLTALVVRASGLALREQPQFNACLEDGSIRQLAAINVGVAIDLDGGLIAPVIRNPDRASLKEVASRLRELNDAAKVGKLTVDDVSEGTFTVTSLEGSGVDAFTPVINPPQAAIIGIGRVRETAAFDGPNVVRRQVTTLSLTFDHRISDGGPAARFLDRIAELMRRPYLLM